MLRLMSIATMGLLATGVYAKSVKVNFKVDSAIRNIPLHNISVKVDKKLCGPVKKSNHTGVLKDADPKITVTFKEPTSNCKLTFTHTPNASESDVPAHEDTIIQGFDVVDLANKYKKRGPITVSVQASYSQIGELLGPTGKASEAGEETFSTSDEDTNYAEKTIDESVKDTAQPFRVFVKQVDSEGASPIICEDPSNPTLCPVLLKVKVDAETAATDIGYPTPQLLTTDDDGVLKFVNLNDKDPVTQKPRLLSARDARAFFLRIFNSKANSKKIVFTVTPEFHPEHPLKGKFKFVKGKHRLGISKLKKMNAAFLIGGVANINLYTELKPVNEEGKFEKCTVYVGSGRKDKSVKRDLVNRKYSIQMFEQSGGKVERVSEVVEVEDKDGAEVRKIEKDVKVSGKIAGVCAFRTVDTAQVAQN